MSMKIVIWMFAVLIVFTCTVGAQDQTPAQTTKTIQHAPIKATSPASGGEMYKTYCAVCHGTDGKGGGPAASALKVPPTDLTQLSKKNGGKYPGLKVSGRDPRRRRCSGARNQGNAGVGIVVLEYEPRARGRSAATRGQPY